MNAREQAARHRAARGLTPEQRHAVACAKYQWWTVDGPHRQIICMGYGADRLIAMGDCINEWAEKWPEIIHAAVSEARAKIERYRASRARPTLLLGSSGPTFLVRSYDHWGRFQGYRDDGPAWDPGWSRWKPDAAEYLRRVQWTDGYHHRMARELVESMQRQGRLDEVADIAWWAREWRRIDKCKSLVPTAYERRRYARKSKSENTDGGGLTPKN